MVLDFGISRANVQLMLKDDLTFYTYKTQNEPLPTDQYKEQRVRFTNWIRTNFRKEATGMARQQFPLLSQKDHWPPNGPDLNLLGNYRWD